MIISANSFDPDEAPTNVGPHLGSKLFDTHVIYQQKNWMGIKEFLREKNKNTQQAKELSDKLTQMQLFFISFWWSYLKGVTVPGIFWNSMINLLISFKDSMLILISFAKQFA